MLGCFLNILNGRSPLPGLRPLGVCTPNFEGKGKYAACQRSEPMETYFYDDFNMYALIVYACCGAECWP